MFLPRLPALFAVTMHAMAAAGPAAPVSPATDPSDPAAAVPQLQYHSVLEGYRKAPDRDQPPDQLWLSANREVSLPAGSAGSIHEPRAELAAGRLPAAAAPPSAGSAPAHGHGGHGSH